MSIAVSAIVRPSRILVVMLSAICIGIAVVGSVIGAGYIGEFSLPLRLLIAMIAIFLAGFGFYHGTRHRKIIHIDISGAGQFRLTEVDSASSCTNTNRPHVKRHGAVVALLKNSTIWPHLLLLRLQSDNGKIMIVPILPDSVSQDSFRVLSVACRWIATRSDSQEL